VISAMGILRIGLAILILFLAFTNIVMPMFRENLPFFWMFRRNKGKEETAAKTQRIASREEELFLETLKDKLKKENRNA